MSRLWKALSAILRSQGHCIADGDPTKVLKKGNGMTVSLIDSVEDFFEVEESVGRETMRRSL